MFNKILVATDGSENAMRAVKAGREIATRFKAEITLLYAAYVPVMYADDLRPEIREALRADGRRILDAAAHLFKDSEIKPRTRLLFDEKAEDGILRETENGGFDLVIIGSRGLDATERKALGSTSMRVIEKSRCPVLVVH
ncbi:universal stress protein [candidate division WOR-3 bacterium]|nr:universal stress protein [candidate division WOR-3 bacterium]